MNRGRDSGDRHCGDERSHLATLNAEVLLFCGGEGADRSVPAFRCQSAQLLRGWDPAYRRSVEKNENDASVSRSDEGAIDDEQKTTEERSTAE